ncbi:MAG TPA: HAMP domain-containing sensor histidine kinase, partial [Actinomycetota bacterium]|nr:HAMP domain-containing sensor histidine kinase [Actinomycetota bacterium]
EPPGAAGRRTARPSGGRGAEDPPGDAGRRADLVDAIVHELRNPLMSVKGLASTGSRMYDSMGDRERREFFRLIDEEAARLSLVAEETSTVLRIDAGRIAYHLRPEPVGRIVEEAVWGAELRGHPVAVDVDPALTAPVDRERLTEVVRHLVDNAVKFSPPDEPIEVRAYRGPDGQAVIEVVDGGPGIAPEIRGRVFERFSRFRPPGYEDVPGAGLGLFICRAHVEAHGGRITAEPAPGRGTMLRVALPGSEEGGPSG